MLKRIAVLLILPVFILSFFGCIKKNIEPIDYSRLSEKTSGRAWDQKPSVSNEAYNATTWDNVKKRAPSMNAVRDKFEASASTFKLDQNVETLTATKTLVTTDLPIQKLDPDGSDRDVVLPAEASSTDLTFWIYNTANGAGEDLIIKDDSSATIVSLGPGMGMMFSCDGTSWVALDDEGIVYDAVADTVSVGSLAATKLNITNDSEPALSISMTSITGTDNQAIDVVGGEALGAEEHWTGIRVKPSDLDPAGADTRIRGIASNLSGVDVSNIPESMDALRLVMPDGRTLTGAARSACDALAIQDGDVNHSFAVPDTAASTFSAYDLILDSGLLSSNSGIHGFSVSTSNGAPSGSVAALAADTYVDPIHQHIGIYSTPDQTTPDAYAGHTSDGGTTWIDGLDGNEIFEKNGDIVWIGSATTFSEIEVIMSSEATKQIGLTFQYSTGASTWSSVFSVDDDTDGFQRSGNISWTAGSLVGWSALGDPGAGDSAAGYWIKITRISGPDPGTPTPTTMKTGAIVLNKWDKDGGLTVADVQASGNVSGATYGSDSSVSDAELLKIVNSPSTTDVAMVELATDAETVAGTSDLVVCTPGNLAAAGCLRDFSTLNHTSTGNITEAQIKENKWHTNNGANAEIDLTLPALSYTVQIIFLVEETQVIEINPPSGEAPMLDGVLLDADDCVDSDAVVGSCLTAIRTQNAAGAWYWHFIPSVGAWVDTGASD